MWAASDLADWWDRQHRESEKELERFVEDNPNLFAVIAATGLSTAMQLGEGSVDVLRFGQGMAQGGLKGFGKDLLRGLSIAGSLGKGVKLLQSFGAARAARLIEDVPGPVCGWVSLTKALRQTGRRMYASVSDLLVEDAMASEAPALGGSTMDQRIGVLRQLGAKVTRFFKVPGTLEELRGLVPRDGSVLMFGANWEREGVRVSHAMYAFYDYLGRFRIADRTGAVVASLQELEQLKPGYGPIGSAVPHSAALLHNVFMKFVGPKGTATLAMEVLALMHSDPETVAQAFEVRNQDFRKKAFLIAPAAPEEDFVQRAGATNVHHEVVRGDTLSKLARARYGDFRKWPVIYEANRKIIGDDPNLIRVGQRLWIPHLPKVDLRRSLLHRAN